MKNFREIRIRAIETENLGFQISYVNTDNPETRAECLANARKIDAADDLLEALTALRDAVDRYFGPSKAGAAWPKYFDPEMHGAWAAINKATGRTK